MDEQKQEQLRAWLTDAVRRNLISITAIERQAKMPASSLMKFISGRRSLPHDHVISLETVLKNAFNYSE